jgi:hypothetical protein
MTSEESGECTHGKRAVKEEPADKVVTPPKKFPRLGPTLIQPWYAWYNLLIPELHTVRFDTIDDAVEWMLVEFRDWINYNGDKKLKSTMESISHVGMIQTVAGRYMGYDLLDKKSNSVWRVYLKLMPANEIANIPELEVPGFYPRLEMELLK